MIINSQPNIFMGFLYSLFTVDKPKRILELKIQIENHKRSIEIIKANMASARANKAPKHYQDSGRKNIATQKSLISSCKIEILQLKGK